MPKLELHRIQYLKKYWMITKYPSSHQLATQLHECQTFRNMTKERTGHLCHYHKQFFRIAIFGAYYDLHVWSIRESSKNFNFKTLSRNFYAE